MLHLFGLGGNSRKPRQPRLGQQQRLRNPVSDLARNPQRTVPRTTCALPASCWLMPRPPRVGCVFSPFRMKSSSTHYHTPRSSLQHCSMSMYCKNISSAASHSTRPSSFPADSPPAANASISPLRHRSSPACSLPSAASVGHASDIPYIVLPPAKTRLHPGRLGCDLVVWPALRPSLLWGDSGTDLVPDSCVRAFREKYIDKSAVLASADSMDMAVGCARRAGNRRVLSRYDIYRSLFMA